MFDMPVKVCTFASGLRFITQHESAMLEYSILRTNRLIAVIKDQPLTIQTSCFVNGSLRFPNHMKIR